MGAVAGLIADQMTRVYSLDYLNGITIGLLFYIISYYVGRFGLYRGLPRNQISKLYTTGIGSFILVFLISWIFLFTLYSV